MVAFLAYTGREAKSNQTSTRWSWGTAMGGARDAETWTHECTLWIRAIGEVTSKRGRLAIAGSGADEIRANKIDFNSYSVTFIPRSLNIRADSLAKGARSREVRSDFVNVFAGADPSRKYLWHVPHTTLN